MEHAADEELTAAGDVGGGGTRSEEARVAGYAADAVAARRDAEPPVDGHARANNGAGDGQRAMGVPVEGGVAPCATGPTVRRDGDCAKPGGLG